jgi:hypothetical protein
MSHDHYDIDDDPIFSDEELQREYREINRMTRTHLVILFFSWLAYMLIMGFFLFVIMGVKVVPV